MTREEAKKAWPIVQAFGEGKTIQYVGDSIVWRDLTVDEFAISDVLDCPERYRVKPELREPREYWVNVYEGGLIRLHTSKESAEIAAETYRLECIKVREVNPKDEVAEFERLFRVLLDRVKDTEPFNGKDGRMFFNVHDTLNGSGVHYTADNWKGVAVSSNSFDDLLAKIESHNPETVRQEKIANLRSELAKLEAESKENIVNKSAT